MCGEQALPVGWTSHRDEEGRTFYANAATGESSWTRPESPALLPEGWSAHQDAEGRTFYANVTTGESSWTCPSVAPLAPTLPEGWSEHQDEQGRKFYANVLTGESSWTFPSSSSTLGVAWGPPPTVQKEFGLQRVNTAAEKADVVDTGSYASRLEERLMCGGFFQQINSFVGKHAHKFDDANADGSGYSLELYTIFKEYETMLSTRCEHFLQSEGLTAEEVVNNMLEEEDEGRVFKSSEYLTAAINFESFVSLMLDFKSGEKDVSRWWEICQDESNEWYNYVPAE